jgi:hypothetical protein
LLTSTGQRPVIAVCSVIMNAIKVGAMIDEAVVRAIPGLSPLLGKHVELIALDTAPSTPSAAKLTVDELLAARIKPPAGVGPISQAEIDRAIAEGALGR